MKSKTAVEQFEAHLIDYGFDLSLHKFEIQTFKEMEKEQIIKFCTEYTTSLMYGVNPSPTEFYNETFKSE